MQKNISYILARICPGLIAAVTLLFSSCGAQKREQPLSNRIAIKPLKKLETSYAVGFAFEYYDGFKLLHVLYHYKPKQDTATYLLLPDSAQVPPTYDDLPVIRTPIKKVVLMSTTQVALFEALGAEDVIAGLPNPEYLWSEKISEMVEKGKIAEVGRANNLNLEQMFKLNPDVVMAVGFPELQYQTYGVLEDSGIPVIYNAEWQERSILGRAEWIKVAAILLDEEEKCKEFFSQSTKTYDSLKRLASRVTERPLVINNLPRRGTWYVSGGNSYVVELIRDAGGKYPWLDNDNTGSISVGFEEIYRVGIKADIWLNAGLAQSKEEIAAADERLTDFNPYKTGEIYVNTKRWKPDRGNDYWESGTIMPHLVLADLIHILHPELLPGHDLFFYQKIE
ncbi:ABC transporter substrate-binding protein [Fulvivirga sp. M361]|uniref:ABC transporter substrate-binding protein n=1 Tax=Fulvivirga sp. M361 TaxID=2594266 RepID=UPI00117AFED0|nr:ABC transporter substrate-binding protein [Fulvivirga sp. M361]TRX62748.1 ABC transporter substrate-binding protein [Fulvivirga sp. M361]